MANPFHDETGRFCSAGEMQDALTRLAATGDFAIYSKLKDEYEDAISETSKLNDLAALKDALPVNGTQRLQNLSQDGVNDKLRQLLKSLTRACGVLRILRLATAMLLAKQSFIMGG
jgi:transcriptional regulator of heat shock response